LIVPVIENPKVRLNLKSITPNHYRGSLLAQVIPFYKGRFIERAAKAAISVIAADSHFVPHCRPRWLTKRMPAIRPCVEEHGRPLPAIHPLIALLRCGPSDRPFAATAKSRGSRIHRVRTKRTSAARGSMSGLASRSTNGRFWEGVTVRSEFSQNDLCIA